MEKFRKINTVQIGYYVIKLTNVLCRYERVFFLTDEYSVMVNNGELLVLPNMWRYG
jgi:hypothetical protein